MNRIMHWLRWFNHDPLYQVIYDKEGKTIPMSYRDACYYAERFGGVVVWYNEDKVLWRPLNANR